jgi:hypothetical protein
VGRAIPRKHDITGKDGFHEDVFRRVSELERVDDKGRAKTDFLAIKDTGANLLYPVKGGGIRKGLGEKEEGEDRSSGHSVPTPSSRNWSEPVSASS